MPKYRKPVTTGWPEIDTITGGGLGKSELGVVIAPTGAGKSMALVHLGTQAIKEGKQLYTILSNYKTLWLQAGMIVV